MDDPPFRMTKIFIERCYSPAVRFLSRILAVYVFLGSGVLTQPLQAEMNSGGEVVLVFNTRVPESRLVAEHYAQMRHVPKNQILGYSLTSAEAMGREEFTDQLQKPLLKDLQRMGLMHLVTRQTGTHINVQESKIRYLVLCFGVPIRINQDDHFQSLQAEKLQRELRRNGAAVDSELACLPIQNEDFKYNGFIKNWVYNANKEGLFNPTNGLLMVTRLDGPSAEIAMHLVDKAMLAETNGLWGRVYIDVRGLTNGNYMKGDAMFTNSAGGCRQAGYDTVVDSNESTFPPEFPMSHIAIYAGWYNENVSGPLAEPNVEFMPGAFAYHLHSFNASTIRSPNKRWVGPLLAKGATVTFGSVDEPYLEFTTDVTALLARWVLLGFTYGEAAYAAQPVLSWQTTIIGDPLYRPFVPNLSQRHEELKKSNSPYLEWSYNRLCNLLLMNSNSPAKVIGSLEELPLTQSSPILQEKLADLLIETGEFSKAIEALQKALKLSSSRQQKVRLTLNLASLFKTANKQEELFDLYSKFVVENRDYPNKLSIYKELAELAHKLGKIQEAESYDRIIKSLVPDTESKK